jgi:outer membrane protein assembly factor BamD (BamD/ComL family)
MPFYVPLLFVLGCTGLASLKNSTAAAEYFKQGESFFEAGKYSEALKEYRTVTAQFPEDELAAAALYKTAYTELYFKNPAADPGTSVKDFQRLIQRYPDSPWKGPAQNWINFLAQMELLKTEREKLKSDLQRLLDLDMQSERKRRDLK